MINHKLILILLALVLAVIGYNFIEVFLYLIAIISSIGSVQRMLYAKGLIKEAEKKGNLLPYIKQRKER